VPGSGPNADDEPPERPSIPEDAPADDRLKGVIEASEAHLQDLQSLFRDLTRRFNN
jgi:hypothetical protein